MTQQQVRQVAAGGTQRVRDLLLRLVGSFLQAQQAAVHAHGIIARDFAERLVDGKFHLRVERIKCAFFGLRVFFGLVRDILARHDLFIHAAQVRRELGIAAVEFTRLGLVFLGHLRFGVTLFPVFRLELFEGIGLLQTDAGQRLDFALQRAHFFELQGILDAFLVFGGLLLVAVRPRPGKCGSSKQENCNYLFHFSPPTTERLTGSFTTWGGFFACFTSIASFTALRSSRFKSSFHS